MHFTGCLLNINLSKSTGKMSAATKKSKQNYDFLKKQLPVSFSNTNKLVLFKFVYRPYSPVLAQEIAINSIISIILKCFQRLHLHLAALMLSLITHTQHVSFLPGTSPLFFYRNWVTWRNFSQLEAPSLGWVGWYPDAETHTVSRSIGCTTTVLWIC